MCLMELYDLSYLKLIESNCCVGYQRELNYRHPDGSYSAFGASDESGSMWLTAFVVKSFAQARSMIQIDERDLKLSVKWIVRRQLENGCFPVVGQVFHKDMKVSYYYIIRTEKARVGPTWETHIMCSHAWEPCHNPGNPV